MEQTFAIIKPDAVAAGLMGDIIRRIESEGIKIAAMRLAHLNRRQAEGFYYVHRSRPFFGSLIDFMTSGPALLMVLSGNDVIRRWRELMGSTDPLKAGKGTIRGDIGSNIEKNAVHGSDSKESSIYEINYFFKGTDIIA